MASSGKSYNQPDLVKVSSPGLEQALQRENSQLRERLGHSAKGFTAMAVALNHVTKEVRTLPEVEVARVIVARVAAI